MPELPEVETVRRVLEPQLCGRTVAAVAIGRAEVIAYPSPGEFTAATTGRMIRAVDRRGKFLRIVTEGGCIVVHLRMTGRLLVTPCGYPAEPHTHVVLTLENGWELRFIDPRRFGRLWFISETETDTYSGIHRLGREPFDPAVNAAYLQKVFGSCGRAVKTCLLDQRAVAGIGNIYSDEILFAAGIDPRRRAGTLSSGEWEALGHALPQVLQKAVDDNATTAEEYLAGRGREYRNTPFFQVYGRAGAPCPRCGAALEKATVAGRSSCFCPACQI